MKKIHVGLTNNGRVLCIPSPSQLQLLLNDRERIINNIFYHLPKGLEAFLRKHPEDAELFPKGFAYWVICKTYGYEEKQSEYGLLKRKIIAFSQRLFRAVRSLAGRIANEIKKLRCKTIGAKRRRPDGYKRR